MPGGAAERRIHGLRCGPSRHRAKYLLHLEEIYGVEVSAELVGRVTDAVVDEVVRWRNRPLDASYPIVFLDALGVYAHQDGKSVNKALYLALGVDWDDRWGAVESVATMKYP